MSSMDGYDLEYFVEDSFMGLTSAQYQAIVSLLEPVRESIEYQMSAFDHDNQSWRAYRNGMWYSLEQYQSSIENILNPVAA